MAQPLTGPVKWVMLGIGWIAVGLAALGAFLPLLPTVPFLLVAAWAFGRSSVRLHGWLYNNRMFGLTQRDTIPAWALVVIGLTLATVSVWIVTRPSGPSKRAQKDKDV